MRRIAFFAHYEPAGGLHPGTLHYLAALKSVCAEVWLISTSPLPAADEQSARQHVDEVVVLPNRGYDFFMWRRGLELSGVLEGSADCDEVILANSSCFGPIVDLRQLFARMAPVGCDFWGITESRRFLYHLQSYFIVFRKTAVASTAFRSFWQGVLDYEDKWNTILSYELGLTPYLQQNGLRPAALISLDQLRPRSWLVWLSFFGRRFLRLPSRLNPPVNCPVELVELGSPFIKKSLIAQRQISRSGWERLIGLAKRRGFPAAYLNQ